MKKRAFLVVLIGIAFFSSCSTTSDVDNIIFYLNKIHVNKKYQVSIYQNENIINDFIIDEVSYFDNLTKLTYYKYQYLPGYEIYNQDEIIVSENNIDYVDELYKLTTISYINSTNFNIENNSYYVKPSSMYKFDFTFINDDISSFWIKYNQDSVSFLLKGNNDYEIKFIQSDKSIYPFKIDKKNYDDFYIDNNISYHDILNKKNENEDFVIALIDENCSVCEKNKKDLFNFKYEYHYQNLYSIDIKDIEEKEIFFNEIKNVYNYQNEEDKLDKYQEYPNDFLTPTLLRVKEGKINKVNLGINVNALHDFCY